MHLSISALYALIAVISESDNKFWRLKKLPLKIPVKASFIPSFNPVFILPKSSVFVLNIVLLQFYTSV